jgi:hypothetical protein
MKELHTFRKFMEGKGSTVKLSQSDMDKLHKDKEIEVDGHTIQFGEGADDSYYTMTAAKRLAKKDGHDFDKLPKFARGKGVAHQQKYLDMAKAEKENVSENTTMPDIDIMGKKFNFSDICPGAHNAIKDLADEYENNPGKLGDVLFLANLHQNFFNLKRKALGPQGIDADELNKTKQLYVEILNIAVNSFGTDTMQEIEAYMKRHMDEIKKAGLKASEPGGSSDRNFEEQLKEVRTRLENEIEGYTDLHKNDVVLESFLGESSAEMNLLRGMKNMLQAIIPLKLDTSTLGSLGYAKATGLKGGESAIEYFTENPNKYVKYQNLIKKTKEIDAKGLLKNKINIDVNTNVLDAYNAISAAANEYDLRENLEEEIKMVKPQRGHAFYKLNKDVNLELQTGSTSVTNAPGVLLHPEFGKTIIAREGQYIINFHGQLFYVDMDAKFATKVPKHDDTDNVKNLRGALVPVDMAPEFDPGWKSYLNKPLEEAAKPDEKAIKALAAKLMKDPKYKARYKGKKGVEFVKTAMADAEKQLKGK